MKTDNNFILDCSSPNTAMRSLSEILQINEIDFEYLLKSIGSIPPLEEPKDYVKQFVFSKIPTPLFPISCIWFHATRAIEPNCYCKEGILPKTMMYQKIYDLLLKLSDGMTKYGENPFNTSLSAKNSINDEGPFAFLYRAVAVSAPGCTHAYYECPELVEDISGSLMGSKYKELVDKFKSLSQPCLVTFRAHAERYALESAIYYTYLLNTGCNELEAADAANTCYDGDGQIVPPAAIIKVDLL